MSIITTPEVLDFVRKIKLGFPSDGKAELISFHATKANPSISGNLGAKNFVTAQMESGEMMFSPLCAKVRLTNTNDSSKMNYDNLWKF